MPQNQILLKIVVILKTIINLGYLSKAWGQFKSQTEKSKFQLYL